MKPRVFLPAIVSGLLLWASFFPLNLGPLAFVALVPYLTLVRAEGVSRRRRYVAAFTGGLAFYLPALRWITVAHDAMFASYFVLAFYCSLYFVLALYVLRRLDRLTRLPLALTLPIVWVALDYCRAHFPSGFPFLQGVGAYQLIGFGWYMLGYTQHATAPLLQLADLGGVYLVTALVCAFNAAAFKWLVRQPTLRRRFFRYPADAKLGFFKEMWTSATVVMALMAAVVYGTGQLNHGEFNDGPRVAAVQGNIPQDVKMDNDAELFQTYRRLSEQASYRADLVIWPETCCPHSWNVASATVQDAETRKRIFADQQAFYQRTIGLPNAAGEYPDSIFKKNVLLGATTFEWDRDTIWRYNSALLFKPGGAYVDRYDKMHLVPFGEYVPLVELFPWMSAFTPYKGDYSCKPGERYTRFPLQLGAKTYTFACIICYEDSDPYLARQYVRKDPVDFLVNISNDGWFRGTEEHEQHLAICRFRAVECRRYIVRAVNMGISAIIDGDGHIVSLPGENWSKSKQMEQVVAGKVKLDPRGSFYAEAGDWLPAGCWAFLVVTLLTIIVKRRLRRVKR